MLESPAILVLTTNDIVKAQLVEFEEAQSLP
jgi:hypothetical protein